MIIVSRRYHETRYAKELKCTEGIVEVGTKTETEKGLDVKHLLTKIGRRRES